jgi:pimeloyl-ACP methyl ester carboxylesterase
MTLPMLKLLPMPMPRSEPVSETQPPALAPAPAPDTVAEPVAEAAARPPCPAPADFRAEVAAYDREAQTGVWEGPRYRLRYRVLGQGPPLILVPGIAATYRGYALMLNRLAGRFRTVIYDFPGEHPDDGARLGRITHEQLVDDLFGLIEHLNIGRVFPVGLSFGSTIVLRALNREPRRFPKAVVQGAFAHWRFTWAERVALAFGRHMPGTTARLPLRRRVLTYNSRSHFPALLEDRWAFYLEQNGLTPIASLAHRLDLVAGLDLRPILGAIPNEVLLLQGNEDRIVARRHYEELKSAMPRAEGVIMPMVGHQPHYTHAEVLARVISDWLLPCAPEGCPNEPKG